LNSFIFCCSGCCSRFDKDVKNYTEAAGIAPIEPMIKNAKKGEKLNTYVSQDLKDNYADKWIQNDTIVISNENSKT